MKGIVLYLPHKDFGASKFKNLHLGQPVVDPMSKFIPMMLSALILHNKTADQICLYN